MVGECLETRRLILKPMEEKDFAFLHKLRNSLEFIKLCSMRRSLVGFDEFVEELRRDFSRDRHQQFLIQLKSTGPPGIGTIFTYNLNLVDGYVFFTICLVEQYQNRGYGVEAVACLVRYLFNFFPLHKIYVEAYDYNRASLNILRKAGFIAEGVFKEHRFFEERRWNLNRYALYRDSLQRVLSYLPEGGKNGVVQRER